MPSIESFLVLEKSLADRLKKKWRRAYLRKRAKILKAVKAEDMQKAYSLIDEIRTDTFVRGLTPYIEYIGMQALLFGASRLTPVSKTSLAKSKKKPKVLTSAVAQYKAIVADMEKPIKKQAHAALKKIIEDKLQRQAEGQEPVVKADRVKNYNELFDDMVLGTGNGMIDIASSLHTSRLSSYGFCVEADVTGVSQYQINEMLDSRICPVCKIMHSQVFEVEFTYKHLDKVLQVDDPEQLKAMAPWPKQTKAAIASLKGMSTEALQQAGWTAPPFHPLCRGILDAVGTVVSLLGGKFKTAKDWYQRTDTPLSRKKVVAGLDAPTIKAMREVEDKIGGIELTTLERYFDRDAGEWVQERRAVHDAIIKDILSDDAIKKYSPVRGEAPRYYLLGGRGGSGKSNVSRPKREGGLGIVARDTTLVLDSDGIKERLPEYAGWNAYEVHEESSYLFNKITEHAARLGLNVAHAMTLRTMKSAKARLKLFKEAGYSVEGVFVHVSREEAIRRVLYRFRHPPKGSPFGRYVPLDVVLSNTNNEAVFDNLLDFFEKWYFFDHNEVGNIMQIATGGTHEK